MKTKNKKLIEKQKIKSSKAQNLFVACISDSTGREVRTEIIGKNFSWSDLSQYTLETYSPDYKILEEENFFEYAEALHCFLTLNHDGQSSSLYALLGRSNFRPGPLWSETRVEKENEVYSSVSGLSEEELGTLMDEIEAYQDNEGNEESVYMVSLFEISRKAYHGDKNNEGLKDFRGHSSHFLSEHGEELCLGDFV